MNWIGLDCSGQNQKPIFRVRKKVAVGRQTKQKTVFSFTKKKKTQNRVLFYLNFSLF